MKPHPHIELRVQSKLDPNQAKAWFNTAMDNLPSGLVAETTITKNGTSKSSRFYAMANGDGMCYVIPLSRDPSLEEVQRVALAWNEACPEGDFEIDHSNDGDTAEVMRDAGATGLREVAMEAAKLGHAEWLKEMQERGWSYGTKFDQRNKRNPLMMPWERLGERYHAQEMRRFTKLMEVLERMDLRLVRRRR